MATSLGCKSSPMELFVETHIRSEDRQKGVQQFIDNHAQHFVETYNSWLRERYRDDPSTHSDFNPDLWMEVRSSGRPEKNWVYGLSNTTAENLRVVHSVSTNGSSNRYQGPSLRSLWPCNNTRLISLKNMSDSRLIMNNSVK
ncbi:hypothetical protein BDE02_15G076300 [Populus trichocarpa]|nr:hypothetical protein BDE02_15G076300 [Populus trichocarpa]